MFVATTLQMMINRKCTKKIGSSPHEFENERYSNYCAENQQKRLNFLHPKIREKYLNFHFAEIFVWNYCAKREKCIWIFAPKMNEIYLPFLAAKIQSLFFQTLCEKVFQIWENIKIVKLLPTIFGNSVFFKGIQLQGWARQNLRDKI